MDDREPLLRRLTGGVLAVLAPLLLIGGLLLAVVVGADDAPAASGSATSPATAPGSPPGSVADGGRTACSSHGLAAAQATDDVVALVRGPRGAVRAVPFEQGWAVYRGERPGTLVAVCRGDRR